MAMNRQLIGYLPPFMQDYAEIRAIMQAEQPEADSLSAGVSDVWNNQFLFDSTEEGVKRRERMLGISSKGTETLDERKFRIYALLNQELPYTLTKLREVLTALCGEGGFSIIPEFSYYRITIKLALKNKTTFDDVKGIAEKMIPANLERVISIRYNSHAVLSAFTHGELSEHTHYELRNEVLS